MNNKEKIELLEKYIQDYKNFRLPPELLTEVNLQANILGVRSIEGALICIRELRREEKDKEIIKIQEQQTEILGKQTTFTKFLAITTSILAIGTIFQSLSYFIFNEGQSVSDNISYFIVTFLVILMAIATILLIEIIWKTK